MQTQLIQPLPTHSAWLVPAGGESTEPQLLESLPFVIGRVDTADLQIKSSRVSREHALIEYEEGRFLIRDLGSTNGTYVNGVRIKESPLADGDVVVIADREFTFGLESEASQPRACVTQMMENVGSACSHRPIELVPAIRALQETVLQGTVPAPLAPFVALNRGEVEGWQGVAEDQDWCGTVAERAEVLGSMARVAQRARELQRLRWAEFAAPRGAAWLLLTVPLFDLQQGQSTLAHLLELGSAVGQGRLVVGLAAASVPEFAPQAALLDCLKRSHIRFAITQFAGSRAQVQPLLDARPEFLVLAPQLVHALHGQGAAPRQLAAVAEAARALQCTAVMTGLRSSQDEAACCELGFELAAWSIRATTRREYTFPAGNA